MPALPLGDAGPYVAAAYLVFLALILIYVMIMATKLARIERQATELNELAARRAAGGDRAGGDQAVARHDPEVDRATGTPANDRDAAASGAAEALPASERVESP